MNNSQDVIFTDNFVEMTSFDDSILELDETSNNHSNISSSVETYLEEVARVPLLKPEQENALFEELDFKKVLLEKILCQLQNSNLVDSKLQKRLEKVFSFKRRHADDNQMTISPEILGRLQDLIADWKTDFATRFPDKRDDFLDAAKSENKLTVDTTDEGIYEKQNRISQLEESEAIFTELQSVVESIHDIQQHLVESNLLLVASIAKQFAFRDFPLSFLDLIQEGSIGLMTAIHKFRLEKGCRFSTYATWWISQAIRRALDEQGQLIRVPTYIIEIRRRAAKASIDLTKRLGREPKVNELAEAVNVQKSRLLDVLRAPKDPLSLDSPVDSNSKTTIADLINDDMSLSPEEEIFRQAQQEVMENLLSTLSPQQAYVIKLRYGLFEGKCHTLAEIGRKMKISRERVRQIESEALKKLRHPTRRHYWKELLE